MTPLPHGTPLLTGSAIGQKQARGKLQIRDLRDIIAGKSLGGQWHAAPSAKLTRLLSKAIVLDPTGHAVGSRAFGKLGARIKAVQFDPLVARSSRTRKAAPLFVTVLLEDQRRLRLQLSPAAFRQLVKLLPAKALPTGTLPRSLRLSNLTYSALKKQRISANISTLAKIDPPIVKSLVDAGNVLPALTPRAHFSPRLARAGDFGLPRSSAASGPITAKAKPAPAAGSGSGKGRRPTTGSGGSGGNGPGSRSAAGGGDRSPGGKSVARKSSAAAEVMAYPNIEPGSEHVVERTPVDITVSLQDQPAAAVTGGGFPLPPGKHVLDVHVLLGTESAWGRLVFDHALGTLDAARVTLLAPYVPPDGLCPIIANFYFQHRWCGEARRNIEVLRSATSEKRNAIPKPAAGPWTEHLHLAPGATPPDLLVRIQAMQGGNTDYKFTVLSPHLNFADAASGDRVRFERGPQDFVATTFDPRAGDRLTTDDIIRVEGRLRRIYESTPPVFQEAYAALAKKAREDATRPEPRAKLQTIQFVSDEPFIPWELMLVRDPDGEQPSEVLAIRHAVGRWCARASCRLGARIPVSKIAVFASDYAGVPDATALPWALTERRYLSRTFHAKAARLRKKDVMNLFTRGGAQSVHFCCHGDMDSSMPDESKLWLEDFRDFTTAFLATDQTRLGLGREHPLVFLNACQLGAPGQSLALVTGWPQTFIDIGASACIAPLWSVADKQAGVVARQFYELTFQQGVPLGEALRRIRADWKKQRSLTHLSYALYGDPAATVAWPQQ